MSNLDQLRIPNTQPQVVTATLLKRAQQKCLMRADGYRIAVDQWVINYKEEGDSAEVKKLQEKVVIAHDMFKQAEQHLEDLQNQFFVGQFRITDEVDGFTDDEIPY